MRIVTPTEEQLEQIADVLRYDADTGDFYRMKGGGNYSKMLVGKKLALATNSTGYKVVNVVGKSLLAHHVAWFLHYGRWPEDHMDHIDHDRTNNRIENLRIASHKINAKNVAIYRNNRSGLHGVAWISGARKWRARINADRRCISLGMHDTLFDAAAARKSAELKHGFHQNHGVLVSAEDSSLESRTSVGVYWSKNKWRAYIGSGESRRSLGYYDNLLDAAAARKSEENRIRVAGG